MAVGALREWIDKPILIPILVETMNAASVVEELKMQLVSDEILEDNGQVDPKYCAVYPSLETDFELWNPNSWTRGHPHDLYMRMREEAPVM